MENKISSLGVPQGSSLGLGFRSLGIENGMTTLGVPQSSSLRPEAFLTFSAAFHSSIFPMYLSGLVERFSLKVKPNTPYTCLRKSRQPTISSPIYNMENQNIYCGIY